MEQLRSLDLPSTSERAIVFKLSMRVDFGHCCLKLCGQCSPKDAHAHSKKHSNTVTRAGMHTFREAPRTQAHTPKHSPKQLHPLMNSYMASQRAVHTHTLLHIRTHPHTLAPPHTQTHSHTHTSMQRQAAHTPKYRSAHAHPHTVLASHAASFNTTRRTRTEHAPILRK